MKKGVSPIVGVLMLLMITVAVSGAVYSWISSTQGSLQLSAEERIEQTEKQMGTRFEIAQVSCEEREAYDIVKTRIRNTGTNTISQGTNVLMKLFYQGDSLGNKVISMDKGLKTDETRELVFNFTKNPTNKANKEHTLTLNLGSVTRETTVNCTG